MYLSSDLVTAVKRRAAIPSSQNTFANSDFYAFADEEIRSKLVPLILKNMEEYYVRPFDYTIVANQAAYTIPSRAIAGKLRNVEIVATGDTQARIQLDRLSPEDLVMSISGEGHISSRKTGFYLQGNQVIMYPAPTAGINLLRLSAYIRPSQVVDTSVCGLITAIDTVNKLVTLGSLPSGVSLTTPVDFVKASPGFECSAIDQTITNIASNVLTFATLPSDLSVGDYVCPANQSCVIQVPVELQPLLYQYVVVRVLSAQSDTGALKGAIEELKALESNAMDLISPRVDGKAKRVVNGRGISRFV